MQVKNSDIVILVCNRLKLFRETTGKSGAQFAKDAGIHPNSYPRYEKTSGFSTEIANKIATAHPELNWHWLLTGRGEMFTSPSSQPEPKTPSSNNTDQTQELIETQRKYIALLEKQLASADTQRGQDK